MRFALVLSLLVAGCSSAETVDESGAAALATEPADGGADDSQAPATLTTAGIEQWLDAKHYESWPCTPIRVSRPPATSTRPMKICSNHLLSTAGPGEYPIGSVDVRIFYDNTHTNIVGRGLSMKTKAGGGEAFYWYEKINGSLNSSAQGDAAQARPCVQCHEKAKPSLFGHDFVFNQVTPSP
jgi:hypothetical protein